MTEPRNSVFTAKQYRTLLLVLPIMLVVGLGLAVWAVNLAQFHVELLLRGQTAMGLVVRLESGTSSSASGRSAWFPVVKFETGDGRSVTFRHRTGGNPSNYSEGASVAVT